MSGNRIQSAKPGRRPIKPPAPIDPFPMKPFLTGKRTLDAAPLRAPHVHKAVQAIKEAGCTAGVALTPSTPVEALSEVRGELWSVLCMTVNPGWGGQPFIPQSLDKLRRLKAVVGEKAAIEVDGGVDLETIGPCAQAGASVFVAGSAVFGGDDPGRAVRELSQAASGG